jgi:hypothetical protein
MPQKLIFLGICRRAMQNSTLTNTYILRTQDIELENRRHTEKERSDRRQFRAGGNTLQLPVY